MLVELRAIDVYLSQLYVLSGNPNVCKLLKGRERNMCNSRI